MHSLNPEKLLHSKWTAVEVCNKEKHFIVTQLLRDDENIVVACEIEAVINHKRSEIDWRELREPKQWLQGWH